MPPKPAHELLGEILLSLGHPDLAHVQFELALLRAPKRALSLLGLARSFVQSGNQSEAREVYDELRNMWSKADPEILKALEESMSRLQGVAIAGQSIRISGGVRSGTDVLRLPK
jgi:TolA-binding protein